MSAVDLEREALTVLPARYETRRWGGGGGNFNFAAVAQSNTNVQVIEGCLIGCVQNNVQINVAVVLQR
jgi:hypothetical protein